MLQDTLKIAANNADLQSIVVIIQGLMLVVGALMHLFKKDKS